MESNTKPETTPQLEKAKVIEELLEAGTTPEIANHVYDQLWLKRGSPERIHIVELELGCDSYTKLRDIIYGKRTNDNFDGVHLHGDGAQRHFTYRAIQAINQIIRKPFQNRKAINKVRKYEDHTNCEQTRYQRRHLAQRRSYADVARNNTPHTEYSYSVPTNNYNNPLN